MGLAIAPWPGAQLNAPLGPGAGKARVLLRPQRPAPVHGRTGTRGYAGHRGLGPASPGFAASPGFTGSARGGVGSAGGGVGQAQRPVVDQCNLPAQPARRLRLGREGCLGTVRPPRIGGHQQQHPSSLPTITPGYQRGRQPPPTAAPRLAPGANQCTTGAPG